MKEKADTRNQPQWYVPFANMRTDCYVLLAALLTNPPGEELIGLIRSLQWDEDIPAGMQRQLLALKQACSKCSEKEIADEFHRLFVGLGRGDLVPYGSWYREKMIQSMTLAAIRNDLERFGLTRQPDSYESEDHAGVLCEIMALISQAENGLPHEEQAIFFDRHLAPWMPLFFKDMQAAGSVEFYLAVGGFAAFFLEAESEYLQNCLHYQNILYQGGMHDEGKIF